MIKLFSAEDILTLPEFQGMNVFDLIKKDNDELIGSLLHQVGADNNKEVEVFPCRHRKIGGAETVNYVYVFWERTDPLWLHSPFSTMEARIEAQKDGELKAEMLRLSHDSASMKFKDKALSPMEMRGIVVETFAEDSAIIKSLKQIMKEIRDL